MTKIIKPLVNADGTQVVRKLQKGDWHLTSGTNHYTEWTNEESYSIFAIYYAEEWKPKEGGFYWFYCFSFSKPVCTVFNSSNIYDDTKRLSLGNCFKTKAEAEDVNNILTVLDNMKKYYQDKHTEAKND